MKTHVTLIQEMNGQWDVSLSSVSLSLLTLIIIGEVKPGIFKTQLVFLHEPQHCPG